MDLQEDPYYDIDRDFRKKDYELESNSFLFFDWITSLIDLQLPKIQRENHYSTMILDDFFGILLLNPSFVLFQSWPNMNNFQFF